MSFGFQYDGPPSRCYGKARPGIIALRDGVRKLFPGCTDMGAYVCRNNTGGAGLSMHADGRAWDAGSRGDLNRRIFDWLVANAQELGVQAVIGTPRRAWTSRNRTVHHYTGTHPHDDHVHVELCKAAANSLTLATVLAIGNGSPPPEDDLTPEQWTFIKAMNDKLDQIQATEAKTLVRLDAIEKAVKDN